MNKRKGITPNKDAKNLVNAKDLERNLKKEIENSSKPKKDDKI